MNFGQLKSTVADWLNRSDLTATIPTFINMAMKSLEREWNYNGMEVQETVTIANTGSADDCYISMPTRYKATNWMKVIKDNQYYPLQKRPAYVAISEYPNLVSDRGRPVYFSTFPFTGEFLLRPGPDVVYDIEGAHYVYSADLSADADTNWWTEDAWECLLFAALVESSPYLVGDARLLVWKSSLSEKITALRNSETLEKTGTSDLQIRGQFVV